MRPSKRKVYTGHRGRSLQCSNKQRRGNRRGMGGDQCYPGLGFPQPEARGNHRPGRQTAGTRSSEASLFPVQLVGAVFITAQSARSEGGSLVFLGLNARRGLVRVTAQEHAYGRLHNRLFDLGRTARGRGASVTWTVQRLKPRRDDGLGEAPPPEASRLSIFYTRPG